MVLISKKMAACHAVMVDNCCKSRVALQITAWEVMIFFCGQLFFEDQIRRKGIRTTPLNPYVGHKILRRGPPV